MNDPRFPIGTYDPTEPIDAEARKWNIRGLESSVGKLRRSIEGLSSKTLNTPIREGGWTIRQVIHHLTDAQLHGYLRFRWACTEDNPAIKTFDQDAWALLPDVVDGPIGPAIRLLESVHTRWVAMLFKMEEAQFARTFQHPELGVLSLDQWLGIYAWHAEHHIAQIRGAIQDASGRLG